MRVNGIIQRGGELAASVRLRHVESARQGSCLEQPCESMVSRDRGPKVLADTRILDGTVDLSDTQDTDIHG